MISKDTKWSIDVAQKRLLPLQQKDAAQTMERSSSPRHNRATIFYMIHPPSGMPSVPHSLAGGDIGPLK